jgi:hypothetical protein
MWRTGPFPRYAGRRCRGHGSFPSQANRRRSLNWWTTIRSGWENDLPKLFINAEPGAILTGAPREFCRAWKNQTEATVEGRHFIQEDSGAEIGRHVKAWIEKHGLV